MDIQKREGYSQEYQWEKVVDAVSKALEETNELATEPWVNDIPEVSKTIEQLVFASIDDCDYPVGVEDIQDFIEDELMEMGLKETARAFIKYRDARSLKRRKGWEMDDLQYSIWDKKYRFENETFDDWLDRVSGGNPKLSKLIRQKKFLFAGRILAHRGLQYHGKKVTYSNCYVMTPPEDNLESIFDSAKELARTYSYGGGCGISIGNLRPKGAEVNNSARFTTGATSFMQLYDLTTGLIGQNGRRGALMISIPDSHPDLVDFMDIKTKDDSITKANISIQMSHEFMVAVLDDKPWRLHWEGEDGKVIEEYVSARDIFRKNAENNWDWAEAGVLYWDTIKDRHLMSEHPEHEFAGVNPCAEEPLMANGSCLLGSLNLSEFVVHPFTDDAYFDYTKFEDAVHISVEGLNEVLDEGLELHPLQGQRDNARDWRQIGLGIMGLADMFMKMGIEYGSEESLKLSDTIADRLRNTAILESSILAFKNGSFPKYDYKSLEKSQYFQELDDLTKSVVQKYGLRNSQILTIAPTGSISTMWGISGGIEPIFATHFDRKTESLHGKDVVYRVYTPIIKEFMENGGEMDNEIVVTSHNLHWGKRIKMQSVWQEHLDASISSTVNLPNESTVEDVEKLFEMAWLLGLKGVTIFRDGCKRAGILTLPDSEPEIEPETELECDT